MAKNIIKPYHLLAGILIIILIISLAISGCSSQNQSTKPGEKVTQLTVFAAASLKGASDTLQKNFSTGYPQTGVKFNLDGTQVLTQQIKEGATPDIFLSASNTYTNELKNSGFLVNESIKNLTSNYIIVITPANSTTVQSLKDLAKPGVKIAMGTKDVPVGMNSRVVISKLQNETEYGPAWNSSLYSNVKTYETTEPGVVTKVATGEVDAGLVYESSYIAAKAGTLKAINISKKDNALQIYTIGIVNGTKYPENAKQFIDFMVSKEGQGILNLYGFRPLS